MSYYCERCGRSHKTDSKIGIEHALKPAGESSDCKEEVGPGTPVIPPQPDEQSSSKATPGVAPEVDPEVVQLANLINEQVMSNLSPMLQRYESEIQRNRETINQLLDALNNTPAPQQQPAAANPLGFVKELGLNPADIGRVVQQWLGSGSGDRRRDLIAQKFIEREESILNSRIDQFLDAMYGDKTITVGEPDE